MKIRRVKPLSLAKFFAVSYGLVGLFSGGFFALFSLTGIGNLFSQSKSSGLFNFFGLASIIALPIFYSVLGFIAGYLGALFYNLIAKIIGGVEIEVDRAGTVPAPTTQVGQNTNIGKYW